MYLYVLEIMKLRHIFSSFFYFTIGLEGKKAGNVKIQSKVTKFKTIGWYKFDIFLSYWRSRVIKFRGRLGKIFL